MRRRRRIPILVVATVIALASAGCGGDGDEEPDAAETDAEQPLSPVEERGRELFVSNCGSCHTLDAAGTDGSVGPDLDEVQADEAEVLDAIETGAGGSGAMPENLVEGEDAQAVAKFVAASGPGV